MNTGLANPAEMIAHGAPRIIHNAGRQKLTLAQVQQTFGCPILRALCKGWDTTTVRTEICGFPSLPEKHR